MPGVFLSAGGKIKWENGSQIQADYGIIAAERLLYADLFGRPTGMADSSVL